MWRLVLVECCLLGHAEEEEREGGWGGGVGVDNGSRTFVGEGSKGLWWGWRTLCFCWRGVLGD